MGEAATWPIGFLVKGFLYAKVKQKLNMIEVWVIVFHKVFFDQVDCASRLVDVNPLVVQNNPIAGNPSPQDDSH